MADEPQGQAPTDSGQEPQTDQQGAAGAQGQEPERFDATYVKQLRTEAAGYRQRVRDLEAKVQQYERAKLTETERLQQLASETERRALAAESRIAQAEIRADFVEKAIQAGVTDLRLAYLAAQTEGLLGAYDPEKGVGKHNFEELRKRYPGLFRTAGGGIDAGASGGRLGGDMNAWIRRAAGRP